MARMTGRTSKWKRRWLPVAVLLLALLAAGSLATAETPQLSIPSYTIDGGGGTSSGDILTVSGTIGQADAGVLVGGSLTLYGGFWPPGVQKPPPPPDTGVTVYLPRLID